MKPLHFIESGKGETLVLLHGFCETSDIWTDIQNQLSNEYHVISIDLPGFGESPLPRSSFSLADIAQNIKSFLDGKDLEKYVMIGHSLGGYIALAFANQFRENLNGLGLFHSSIFIDTQEKKDSRTKLMDFISKHGVAMFIKTFVPSLFYEKNIPALKPLVESLRNKAAQTQASSVIEYARAMRDRESSVEMIKNINIPVMFIIGEEDGSVPLEKSLEQAILPANSHILRLPETSHMGMYEKPIETFKFINRFLKFC